MSLKVRLLVFVTWLTIVEESMGRFGSLLVALVALLWLCVVS